jgi:outer membrane protein, heavy metal efflux system
VIEENKGLIKVMIKLSEVRYPYNQGNLSNIYKAQARLHEIENMELMTRSEIKQKNIGLNTLMNVPRGNEFRIDTTLLLREVIQDVDTSILSGARSDIRRIDQTIQVMRLNQGLESVQLKPDFGIRYEHMRVFGSMPNQFTLMGMISLPIAPWSSKMVKANIKAMNYEIEAMKKERETLLNEALGMLESMATEITTKKRQLQNYESKILPALRKNYQTTLLAYQENTGDLPVVIDAWEALNMAQMEYLNNLQQLLTMQVSYEKELEK